MDEIRRRIRTPDAARYVGLAKRTLEKMRLTGDGPRFYKLGRAVVYDTQDLDAWLHERARRSTSDPGRCSA
jgi:predicted DNA-binding transcriptional regulator AlpA